MTVFDPHNYTTTLVNASAVSLKAGTDVDCGTTYSTTLASAVNQSLVSEDQIRTALVRLYGSLVRCAGLGWLAILGYANHTCTG